MSVEQSSPVVSKQLKHLEKIVIVSIKKIGYVEKSELQNILLYLLEIQLPRVDKLITRGISNGHVVSKLS